MAQPKLPLRIKVDARDQFDAPGSAVQKAFATLADIVGLKVICNPQWDLLFNALETQFEDKGTFVPTIVDSIIAWCDVLSTRLGDDHFEEWTDKIVDKVQVVGSVKLSLETTEKERPVTTLSNDDRGFIIAFPLKVPFSARNVSAGFESDFQDLFLPPGPTGSSTDESLAFRTKDDEWAEIDETGDAASVSVNVAAKSPTASSRPEKMPNVASLPTPDILLKTLTPYILHVVQKGSGRLFESGMSRVFGQGAGSYMGQGSSTTVEQGAGNVVVFATHSPSLQFLSQYLQRWIKKDHHDSRKVPLLRIALHDSNFGLGNGHDMLTIEPYDTPQEKRGVTMNVTLILSVIENVLGYRCLPRVSPSLWEYRRDRPFE